MRVLSSREELTGATRRAFASGERAVMVVANNGCDGGCMFGIDSQKTSRGAARQPDAIAAEIAAMLAQILAKQSVKLDDDFFDLGGDSLSATELMIGIQGRF